MNLLNNLFLVKFFFVDEKAIELPKSAAIGAASGPAQHASELTILDFILGSGYVVQGVLVLLIVMSVITWGIVIAKYGQVRRAKGQTKKFNDVFWNSNNLTEMEESSKDLMDSPVAHVFSAGLKELKEIVRLQKEKGKGGGYIESVDRALKRAKTIQLSQIEKGTTYLATTASAAPFIGLFGTVWGIMNAFIGLSTVKTTSIQAVAPGISEALVATAIGLAAAIPAAVAYNFFMQQLRELSRDMDMFSAQFLNIAKMHFVK